MQIKEKDNSPLLFSQMFAGGAFFFLLGREGGRRELIDIILPC